MSRCSPHLYIVGKKTTGYKQEIYTLRQHSHVFFFPSQMKLPNCLRGFSTRQLGLLLWTARPDSQAYPQHYAIFFMHLNNVYKCKFLNKVLPPYVNSPCQMVAHYREFHSLLLNEAISGKHWEVNVGLSGFALHSNGSNCLILILYRQLGNYLLSIGNSFDIKAKHIHKTSYK